MIGTAVVAGAMIVGCGGASGASAAKPHGISEKRAAAQGADFLPGSGHASVAKHVVKAEKAKTSAKHQKKDAQKKAAKRG